MHPFAPSLVRVSLIQLFWNEWRGRRDSNSRPLPWQILRTYGSIKEHKSASRNGRELLLFPRCSQKKRRNSETNEWTDWHRRSSAFDGERREVRPDGFEPTADPLLRRYAVQNSKCRFWCRRLQRHALFISLFSWTEDGLKCLGRPPIRPLQ